VTTATQADLEPLLHRPPAQAAEAVREQLAASPIPPADAIDRTDLDRLLDRAPLAAEVGWCHLPDGVGYVAVRTEMPGVTAAMIDWWFEWHPNESIRYQVWFPGKHEANSWKPGPGGPRRKRLWGSVHYPVEDVGLGMQRLRIAFERPTKLGFSTDGGDLPGVATIVCGRSGLAAIPVDHTLMTHVFLNEEGGLVLRSNFWIGALVRPAFLRRLLVPKDAPRVLAAHCAQEYANLATILPGLYRQFGPTNESSNSQGGSTR
jgi:phloretin hydrolase